MEVEKPPVSAVFKEITGESKSINVHDASQERGLETNKCNTNGKSTEAEGDERNRMIEGKPPRRRHRRGSKKNKPRKPRHKYKPYNKLTWDEKRKLDELDALKAVRRREELVLQKGRAIAPYNTTQFLMEEHDPGEENLQSISHSEHNTVEHEDSSSSYSSDEYFDKDFHEFYERVHIDTLNSYSKEDLIKNVYELEERIERLERDAKDNDIQSLKDENKRLVQENEDLKEKVLTQC